MMYKLSYDVDREKMMNDFIKNDCVACGGNWSAMIISGMRRGRYWWLYDELDDNKSYDFFTLCDMVYGAIDERIRSNIDNNNAYLRERLTDKMLQYGDVIGHYNRSNAYVGCDEYVVKYLNQYWCIKYVDGVCISLEKSHREHGIELDRMSTLRRYA